MSRFMVVETVDHKYQIVDRMTGRTVRFSFSNPPMYGDEKWNNYYSARGFADRLSQHNKTEGAAR